MEIPAENAGDDAITVTGRKEHVEKAVAELKRIQDELVLCCFILSIYCALVLFLLNYGRRLGPTEHS